MIQGQPRLRYELEATRSGWPSGKTKAWPSSWKIISLQRESCINHHPEISLQVRIFSPSATKPSLQKRWQASPGENLLWFLSHWKYPFSTGSGAPQRFRHWGNLLDHSASFPVVRHFNRSLPISSVPSGHTKWHSESNRCPELQKYVSPFPPGITGQLGTHS